MINQFVAWLNDLSEVNDDNDDLQELIDDAEMVSIALQLYISTHTVTMPGGD